MEDDKSIIEKYPIITGLIAGGVAAGVSILACEYYFNYNSNCNECSSLVNHNSTRSPIIKHGTSDNYIFNNSSSVNADKEVNYTPVPPELVKYIKDNWTSITEVCAGTGANAQLLRKEGLTVHAFDAKSVEGVVEYGINGTVENKHDDPVLMICSGFDTMASINTFTGNNLIIGGYIERLNVYKELTDEYIESLADPRPISLPLNNGKAVYKLSLRPSYKKITQLGWKLSKVFIYPLGKDVKWSQAHAFYIFTRQGFNMSKVDKTVIENDASESYFSQNQDVVGGEYDNLPTVS